jgi:hypothetical protein
LQYLKNDMKKATYFSLIFILSLIAALEISICLFIPDWQFDGGLAGGAIAGAIAISALLITAVSFVTLITISLALGLLLEKRKIISLHLILIIIFLPAWGVVQYNLEQGNNFDPNHTQQEKKKIEEQLRRTTLELAPSQQGL